MLFNGIRQTDLEVHLHGVLAPLNQPKLIINLRRALMLTLGRKCTYTIKKNPKQVAKPHSTGQLQRRCSLVSNCSLSQHTSNIVRLGFIPDSCQRSNFAETREKTSTKSLIGFFQIQQNTCSSTIYRVLSILSFSSQIESKIAAYPTRLLQQYLIFRGCVHHISDSLIITGENNNTFDGNHYMSSWKREH